MNENVLLYTQIGPILAYIGSLFLLYKLVVSSKDATIQFLKERIDALNHDLTNTANSSPDVLAKSLSDRVKTLEGELERISKDKALNAALIKEKEDELRATLQKADALTKSANHAIALLEQFLCPHCGAPLEERSFAYESVEDSEGREHDIDHIYVEYTCGYSTTDGIESSPCGGRSIKK